MTWLHAAPARTIDLGELRLRRWRADDVDALYEAVLDSLTELRAWMPWAEGYDRAQAVQYCTAVTPAGWEAGSDFLYAVVTGDGTIVGSCGLHARLGRARLEVGYWVRTAHTGRGIATLAAAGLTREALRLDDVEDVEIHCDRANERSARIPARLGFDLVDEGPRAVQSPGEVGVELVWRMGRSDFPTSPARRLLDATDATDAAHPTDADDATGAAGPDG